MTQLHSRNWDIKCVLIHGSYLKKKKKVDNGKTNYLNFFEIFGHISTYIKIIEEQVENCYEGST